jgi:hypothetical protein
MLRKYLFKPCGLIYVSMSAAPISEGRYKSRVSGYDDQLQSGHGETKHRVSDESFERADLGSSVA